jgi:hypothetical protein
VLLSSHPDIAAFPVPKGKHVGVDFFGRGHPSPPAGRQLQQGFPAVETGFNHDLRGSNS